MKIQITTFGCKVNQYESSAIADLMQKYGHSIIDGNCGEIPDIHIVNSCAVTENSVRKVKSLISRIKKNNSSITVVLCGCYPKAFPLEAGTIGADTVIGGILTENALKSSDIAYLAQPYANIQLPLPLKFKTSQSERTRAFLKIQDGCNRNCAYCIIPKARGELKSRPIDEIRNEALLLAEAGHREIVLSGINLCAYNSHGKSLVDAVEAVCGIERLDRVRLSSLEPDLLTADIITRLSKLPKLCEHFHLSLQSGSDTVLARMNRRYDTAFYRDIVSEIRAVFPKAAITADIIVGFPGETEDEFTQTLAFAKEINFAKIHTFAYSKRDGTVAATMNGQLTKAEKQSRSNRLSDLAAEMRQGFFNSLIGSRQQVLIETVKDGVISGHTRCYTPVKITAGNVAINKNDIVDVNIVGVDGGF